MIREGKKEVKYRGFKKKVLIRFLFPVFLRAVFFLGGFFFSFFFWGGEARGCCKNMKTLYSDELTASGSCVSRVNSNFIMCAILMNNPTCRSTSFVKTQRGKEGKGQIT